jgi:hypothetical protein
MSVTRPLCLAVAAAAILGALCIPSAQLASEPALHEEDMPEPVELPAFKPVAKVSSLMTGFGTAMGEIHGLMPQTDNDYRLRGITAWSEIIGELSNVHTRHRRHPEYLKMAANTRALALDLALEARAERPDEMALETLISELDQSCATCHDSDY